MLECLAYTRHGDILYVHSIDRLASNAKDLLNLVEQLIQKQITVIFVKNNLTFSANTKDHMAKLQLTMLATFVEFERELMRERQREGIVIARANGKYSGRRKVTEEIINIAKVRLDNGEPLSSVSKSLSISRQSLYKYGLTSLLPFVIKASNT